MSQFDFTDLTGVETVSELRRQVSGRTNALRSNEAGTAPPSSPVALQFHNDSANGIFVQRNVANSEWIFMWQADAAPHSFVHITGAAPTTTIVTELDSTLNLGGFTNLEEQGADTFVDFTSLSGDTDVVLPDPSTYPRWDGRLCCVHLQSEDSGYAVEIKEGSTGNPAIARLTRPGDYWIGRIRGGALWEEMATNARSGVREVSVSTVTVDNFTGLYLVDTSSNSVTLSFPIAWNEVSGPVTFKKTAAANTMTIDTAGSELIDGAASVAKTSQYEWVTIEAYNGALHIVGQG